MKPSKTSFGHYNYLTPGPSHHSSRRPSRIDKLTSKLKEAADAIERAKPLIEALKIEGESLQGLNEASRS